MIYTIKAYIHNGEETGYISECVDLPIVTQGQTSEECALKLTGIDQLASGRR